MEVICGTQPQYFRPRESQRSGGIPAVQRHQGGLQPETTGSRKCQRLLRRKRYNLQLCSLEKVQGLSVDSHPSRGDGLHPAGVLGKRFRQTEARRRTLQRGPKLPPLLGGDRGHPHRGYDSLEKRPLFIFTQLAIDTPISNLLSLNH